jgi:hypothetical protein
MSFLNKMDWNAETISLAQDALVAVNKRLIYPKLLSVGIPHPAAYVLLARRVGPYFQRRRGAGIPRPIPMKASIELPQSRPRASYMYGANNGLLSRVVS